jgi:hypothetical protein
MLTLTASAGRFIKLRLSSPMFTQTDTQSQIARKVNFAIQLLGEASELLETSSPKTTFSAKRSRYPRRQNVGPCDDKLQNRSSTDRLCRVEKREKNQCRFLGYFLFKCAEPGRGSYSGEARRIYSHSKARNSFVGVEHLTEDDLELIRKQCELALRVERTCRSPSVRTVANDSRLSILHVLSDAIAPARNVPFRTHAVQQESRGRCRGHSLDCPQSDAASHAEAIMTLNVEIDAALVQLREMLERLAPKPCAKHDWRIVYECFQVV